MKLPHQKPVHETECGLSAIIPSQIKPLPAEKALDMSLEIFSEPTAIARLNMPQKVLEKNAACRSFLSTPASASTRSMASSAIPFTVLSGYLLKRIMPDPMIYALDLIR